MIRARRTDVNEREVIEMKDEMDMIYTTDAANRRSIREKSYEL